MSPASMPIVRLSEMEPDQEGDLFVLLSAKEELLTREGKPYFRVTFRDARREVSFPVWDNSPLAADCRQRWTAGTFYKIRAVFRQTKYGPQLDIRKIREVTESDSSDGFDPWMCLAQSRFPPDAMFEAFIAAYPAGIYVDEARFKIGTAYYNSADYANAQTAYTNYFNTYPDNKDAGDAHYWVGRCIEHLQGTGAAAAITQYNIVTSQYPNCSKYCASLAIVSPGTPCP